MFAPYTWMLIEGRLRSADVAFLDPLDRDLFLSVECGTIDQAERSLAFLRKACGSRLIED